MLGFIFREFFEFANDRLGSSAVDAALSRCQLSTGGKYVNGGEYPPTELVQALGEICRETGHHSRDLLLQFGESFNVFFNCFNVRDGALQIIDLAR